MENGEGREGRMEKEENGEGRMENGEGLCSVNAQSSIDCSQHPLPSPLSLHPSPFSILPSPFSSLLSFSGDDPEAARSILATFIEETEKNIGRMETALSEEDVSGVAAMAHKLLPLLTMIGAQEIVTILSELEGRRDECFSDALKQKTEEVIPLLRGVVDEARNYLSAL